MAQANSNHRCTGLLVAVAIVAVSFLVAAGDASSVGFDLHHRFSPVVRQWAEARGHPFAAQDWPARGSPEYYSALSRHDRAVLSRRALADGADGLVTFAAGNDTLQYIGSLYYAVVEVGTPNATFLVALDTGSDLFWVPCDCKQCASIANVTGQPATALRPYSPRESSTSKQVTCDNALCDRPNGCSAATNGVGRINFGDSGSSGQGETPFTGRRTLYNVSFTAVNVETKSVAAEFAAVIDSGTSFTYLADPEYTELATNFNSLVRERRTNFSSGSADPFPFEYCYALGPNQTEALIPDVSLTTKGGARFPVTQPVIGVAHGGFLLCLCTDYRVQTIQLDFGSEFRLLIHR